jgi:F-type H+-transporting ATPase subunit b
MATWISEIVGFLVILFVIYRYVVPPARKAMNKQQELIRQQIADSEAAAARLREAEQAYDNAVTEARVDAAKIRDDARADAQAIEEEMRAHAEREVERIRQRGEEQLALQRAQLSRELRVLVGQQASELAGRMVREHLSDDARRAATVDRFLDELESMSAPSGPGKGES